MGHILTAALLISAFCGLGLVMGAPAVEQEHCSIRFQEAFDEVVRLKKTCGGAQYKDCCQIAEASETLGYTPESGSFYINNPCVEDSPFNGHAPSVQARCNMDSSKGGWIVLVKRTPDTDERVSFDRNWIEYENGFGNLSSEFWYGLKNMHCLTTREPMEVEVEVSKRDGTKILMSYGEFVVKGPDTSYTLQVSDKRHDGFDFLGYYHTGMKFTTKDRQNDNYGSTNCAAAVGGGWWYNACYNTALTFGAHPQLFQRSTGTYMPFDFAEMRVRPKTCRREPSPVTCQE